MITILVLCALVFSSGCAGLGIDPNMMKNSIKIQVPITKAPMVYATQGQPSAAPSINVTIGNYTPTPTPTKSRFVYV